MQNVTIVVLFFTTTLVLLGSLSFVEALTSVIIPLPSITNEIFLRNIGNTNPQDATIVLDKPNYAPNEDVITTVTDLDSNLDPRNIDMVMATLQTPSGFNKIVILSEQGNNLGIFSGTAILDNVLPGETLTASYTLNPAGVGRFFGIIGSLTGSGNAEIQDSNFRNTPSIDSFDLTCPFDLYTHTVDVRFSGVTVDPDTMFVTMSYANTVLGDNTEVNGVDFEDLEVLYRPQESASLISLTSDLAGHDSIAKTITSQLPPNVLFFDPFPTVVNSNGNGQYALGIDLGSCTGGGGGGIVRPDLSIMVTASIIGGTVGGELIPLDTTALLLAGTHSTASWMIPIIVSGIGLGFVLVRSFRNSVK